MIERLGVTKGTKQTVYKRTFVFLCVTFVLFVSLRVIKIRGDERRSCNR